MTARRITYLSAALLVAAVWAARRVLDNRSPESIDQLADRRATLTTDDGTTEGGRMTEPITGSLEPYVWDSEAAVAYEAAVEAINGVVGAYSALISREEKRSAESRDATAISEWHRLQGECQQTRQGIDPDDAEQVRAVRSEYAARLRELRGLMAG